MSLADLYSTPAVLKPVPNHNNPLYCKYCDKSFRSFASYTRHIEVEHQITNGKTPKISCVPDWDSNNDICDQRCCGNSSSCVIL